MELTRNNFLILIANSRVEQLAELCLSAMRETQACGPYHMCGYSFGAIIAYEVALRLRRNGEDVGVLA